MKTKSGKHVIFDITEFLPGKRIPDSFVMETNYGEKPYFFQPASWSADNDWGGSYVAQYRGFPMVYSTGFATAELALEAAESWEAGQEERDNNDRLTGAMLSNCCEFNCA